MTMMNRYDLDVPPVLREGATRALLRFLAMLWLIIHLVSLAASQTTFGPSFSTMRWISLGAFAACTGLCWVMSSRKSVRLNFVKLRIGVYLTAWTITVLISEHPLFAGYRLIAHSVVIVSTLVLLPEILRLRDYSILLASLTVSITVILVVSYFRPAPLTYLDNPNFFRGILGNANAFGHMAAVGAILFVNGFLTARTSLKRRIFAAFALLALVLIMRSGARSSLVAVSVGFGVLYLYYKERISKYGPAAAAGIMAILIAFPALPNKIEQFVLKHHVAKQTESFWQGVLVSRNTVWDAHIQGFLQRPIFGWGFGVDADTDLIGWDGRFSSTGFTGRDPVNDTLYTLESGGIVGLVAYFMLVALLYRAWRPRAEPPMPETADPRWTRDRGHKKELHVVFLALACSLAMLFQFDNTALAAGNFFATLFWLTLGAALALSISLTTDAQRAWSLNMYGARGLAVRPLYR